MTQQSDLKVEDYRLQFPFSMLVCGSTASGKTTFTLNLVEKRKEIINTEIEKVIYVYGEYQTIFDEIKEKDKIVNFVPNIEEAETLLDPKFPTLLIFDDILTSLQSDRNINDYVTRWFVQRSHHQNTAVILQIQTLFPKSCRNISLNTTYLVLMKQIRDKTSARFISQQFSPNFPNFIPDALEQATKEGRGKFILLDLHHGSPEFWRVRSFLWPTLDMRVFFPTKPK